MLPDLNIGREGDDKYASDALPPRRRSHDWFLGRRIGQPVEQVAILSVRNDKSMIDLEDIEAILEKQAVGLIILPLETVGVRNTWPLSKPPMLLCCAHPGHSTRLLQVSIRPEVANVWHHSH